MKKAKFSFLLLLLVSLMGTNAWGHSRYRTHVSIGVNTYWGGYGYAPHPYWPDYSYYPYYQPVVIQQTRPVIYVERPLPAITVNEPVYWYYCKPAKAYYPYVKECTSEWMKVVPQPAN